MKKKGQIISIVAFVAIVLAVLVLGTLLMSFVNTILNPVQDTFVGINNQSAGAVGAVKNSFNQWWDIALTFLFFLNVIILLISSYMVDTHPIFLVVYIIAVMFLIIFGGNVVSSLSSLWDTAGVFGTGSPQGVNALANLPITVFILNHFTLIILGIIIISGVIMYAKFKFSGGY